MTQHRLSLALAAAASLVLAWAGCQSTAAPQQAQGEPGTESARGPEQVLWAAGGDGLPGAPNRVGVPVTGGGGAQHAAAQDDDEPKDYWRPIVFGRTHFEEVREFVRQRYIDAKFDEARALAQAASFALASDEEGGYLLVPEAFYKVRKDNPDEEGLLGGKVTHLRPGDKFVLLTETKPKSDDGRRLSDEEIRVRREKYRARTRLLDKTWREAHFTQADFERVMSFCAGNLGKKDKDWSMKRAWVAAAQGYLYSLDPHSALLPKAAWEDSMRETADASFEGIGAILTRRPNSDFTVVESPIEGQPAVKAGLRAGDEIHAVDGKSIKGELLSKVVKRIRGPKGTVVVLTVLREGHPKPLDVRITRSHIDIKNVSGHLLKDYEDIGWVKVTGFIDTTDDELARHVAELKGKTKSGQLRGLVLDLRNNTGGLLQQGIRVADRFLSDGIIVSVRSRDGEDEIHRATPGDTWDFPVVVLVNDGSASAAEIVASALQDNGRALVMGDRTFGKASVQTLFSPRRTDAYYVKLTVARYYGPLGTTLQVVGVHPDVSVPPEFGGKMPLGFREENLSHHLPPIQSKPSAVNAQWAARIAACADKDGKAPKLHAADPNPAVKFDYQRAFAADSIDCMRKLGMSRASQATPIR